MLNDHDFANLFNQLLPSKQPPLYRLLLLLLVTLLAWATLSGVLVGLFALVAPEFHAASMTYANALGWVGFSFLALDIGRVLGLYYRRCL
jgi:hypothetical protein